MFILIDNYDSFTYNLYHYLGELGAEIEVHRNDKITVDEVLAKHPQGIILSPGPCDPDTTASTGPGLAPWITTTGMSYPASVPAGTFSTPRAS